MSLELLANTHCTCQLDFRKFNDALIMNKSWGMAIINIKNTWKAESWYDLNNSGGLNILISTKCQEN